MTWRQLIRKELDIAVKRCADYEEMLLYLKKTVIWFVRGSLKNMVPIWPSALLTVKKPFVPLHTGKRLSGTAAEKKGSGQRIMCRILNSTRIRLYRISFHIQTATYYQLYHVAHYHKVKHFYNHQGWKYRKRENGRLGNYFCSAAIFLHRESKVRKNWQKNRLPEYPGKGTLPYAQQSDIRI